MSITGISEPSPGTEPRRAGGINGRVVLNTVYRRPVALIGVAVLAAAAAAGVWFLVLLPKHTAAVTFDVASVQPTVLGPTLEGRVDPVSYRQSQVALIKRRLTINAALKDPAVRNLRIVQAKADPVAWLDGSLKVEIRTGSEYIKVSLEGEDGDELRTLLDAVAKAYLAAVDERDNGVRKQRLAKLEETKRSYQADLERFQDQINTIALALGSKDGPTLAIFDALSQDELREAARDLASERRQLQWAEQELAAAGPANKPDADKPPGNGPPAGLASAVEREVRRNPKMRELEEAVRRARASLAETESRFDAPNPTHPSVTRAQNALKAAEERRDKYADELRPEVEAALKEGVGVAGPVRAADLPTRVAELRRRVAAAKQYVDEVQAKITNSNRYRLRLETLKAGIAQTERLSSQLSEEVERVKVELGAPLRVTLVEEPVIVAGLEGNRRMKFSLFVAVGVFLAGFAGLVGLEYRGRRVTHADEVTTALGVRLIGTIPPHAQGGRGPAPDRDQSVLVESVDTARTMLLHGTPGGAALRTLLVTSPVAGEGKTSLSGHLAISLSRAGFRTLLIDGDLLAPSVHSVFGLPDGPGLCELLNGETDLGAAVRPSAVPGLSVLTAGRPTPSARQQLMGEQWRRIKQQLESRFDFLVVDTSPLLLVSDTMLLAREADGVILSVLLGVSQITRVAETADRLKAIGAKLVGVVVNGVPSEAYRVAARYGSRAAYARPSDGGHSPEPRAAGV